MKTRVAGCLLALSIVTIGLAGCGDGGSSGSALGISGGTGSQAPGFTQVDLTGTWDMYKFQTSTLAGGSGWFRLVVRFDGNGTMFIDDNTTWETTTPDDAPPNGPSGDVWTINSSGVITETGSPTFHGNMASNKQFIVATTTLRADRAIGILRKRVPGVTYTNADLFNKSFAFHILSAGGRPEWERGDGSINTTGSVTLANLFNSSGAHSTNMVDIARFSISTEGVVTDALDPDFKGFLTPDKKILIGTGTNPLGPAGTNYDLMILTISGQTFSQPNFAGTWNFTQINCGTESEWAYGALTANASGNATLTLAARSDTGPLTPVTDNLSLGPSGILKPTADPTSTFQGVMSYNKDFVFVTDTGQSGGVFTLSILMK